MKEEKTRKTDRRTLYTIQVIKDSYLELLHEKSWEKISVTELCKRAEINRTTFYLHYESSTHVLEDILNELFEKLMADLSDISTYEERTQVSAQIFQKIIHDKYSSFLIKCGMSYPPFIQRLCNIVVDADMRTIRQKTSLPREELRNVLFMLYYGYFSLENYWAGHYSLKKIDEYGQLYEKYVLNPAYDKIFHSPEPEE